MIKCDRGDHLASCFIGCVSGIDEEKAEKLKKLLSKTLETIGGLTEENLIDLIKAGYVEGYRDAKSNEPSNCVELFDLTDKYYMTPDEMFGGK